MLNFLLTVGVTFAALFILIYYVIGTMVSSTSAKARTSLVAILLIWTGFQLVIPKLSDIAAALISPVRTDTQVSLEKSLLINTLRRCQRSRYAIATGPSNKPGSATANSNFAVSVPTS